MASFIYISFISFDNDNVCLHQRQREKKVNMTMEKIFYTSTYNENSKKYKIKFSFTNSL